MKRRTHTKVVNARVRNIEKGNVSWSSILLTIFCAAIIAVGFFFAALQHFATIDLGFKNSNLRKQVEDLNAEKRRLLLAKEVALSPAEITKTARNLGFREVEPEIINADSTIATTAQEPKAAEVKTVLTESDKKEIADQKIKTGSDRPRTSESAKVTTTAITTPVKNTPVKTKVIVSKLDQTKQNGESRARRVVDNNKDEKRNTVRTAKLR